MWLGIGGRTDHLVSVLSLREDGDDGEFGREDIADGFCEGEHGHREQVGLGRGDAGLFIYQGERTEGGERRLMGSPIRIARFLIPSSPDPSQ